MSLTWVKVFYALLLGVVLALTAGFATAIFVSEPRPPQSPGLSFSTLSGNSTDQESSRISKQIDAFFDDAQSYRQQYPDYQRNIFVCFVGIGILFGIVGVALPALVNFLRLGFIIGGGILIVIGTWFAVQPVPPGAPNASNILSLLSFGTPKVIDTAGRFLRFAVAIVGVLLLLFVGLWRLTEWSSPELAGARAAGPAARPQGEPGAAAPREPLPAAPPAATAAPADAQKWARPEDQTTVPTGSAGDAAPAAGSAAPEAPPAAPAAPPEGTPTA